MPEIKVKVHELYELRALVLGMSLPDESGRTRSIYPGFVNEVTPTEGTKRLANKIGKVINEKIKEIDEQRKKIREQKIEDKTEEEVQKIRDEEETELLNDTTEIHIEELISFKKVEDLKLTFNYQFLYEKLFKD